MKHIIGASSSGKTKKLMTLALETHGIYVSDNIDNAKDRAINYFGADAMNIEFASYLDLVNLNRSDKPIYLDDLDKYLKLLKSNIRGYAVTLGDEDEI